MLESLLQKFTDERNQLEKEEMSARHAFEMVASELTQSSAQFTNVRATKAKTKASREEAAAEAARNLADTTAVRKEDATYLRELNAQCSQKSSDFEQRQQLRQEELEAIRKAIQIIQDGVSNNAEKHLSFVQTSLMLRAATVNAPVQRHVAAFLQGRATKLDSHVLSLIAARARDGPFDKVTKMIKDMITRLLNEANEEAEHKGWCDTEMAVNKQTRDDKTAEVDTLSAECDQLKAEIAQLGEDIADLSTSIAETDAAVKTATEVREKEAAKNAATIADAKEASAAVAQ